MHDPAAGAILLLGALAGRRKPSLPEQPTIVRRSDPDGAAGIQDRLCRSHGSLHMNETCDRCGPAVGAVYRVHERSELYLCRHCAARLWPALSAQGWTITPVSAYAGAPQTDWYAGDTADARE